MGYWKRNTRGARKEGRRETDIIISIGSVISVGCEFYNEAVGSIGGIECKCNCTNIGARFRVEMDYIMHNVLPGSAQGAGTGALGEMRPHGGVHTCCVTCLFWSFVPHLRKSYQLQIFCTVSSYLLFIITHPAFFTHTWGYKANHTISGSQDNLSKPIKITIADGKQINADFNPELLQYTVECDFCYSEFKLGPRGAGNALHQHRGTNACQKKALHYRKNIAKQRIKVRQ